MDKTFTLETPATPADLYVVVSDLATYPEWIDFVHKVEPAEPDDGEPAWWVTLRARLGPLARSKRLRMVRVVDSAPDRSGNGLVRFERRETDGRDHAEWILEVSIQPADIGSEAHCRLAYTGGLWAAPLEPLLDQAASESSRRLAQLVDQTAT